VFARLVIGYDGSPNAQAALALGDALAAPGAELIAVSAHPPGPLARMRSQAEAAAAEASAALERDPPVRSEVRQAVSPARALLLAAAEHDADALVIGASHSRAARVAHGDVLARALHDAPCAVAVATAAGPPEGERPVVVGFDGSDESREALWYGAALARRWEAPLDVLWAGGDGAAAELLGAAVEGLGERLRCDAQVVEGHPVEVLVERSGDAAAVVLGSHGRGALGRVAFGSVAMSVVGDARSAVLVVPRGARPLAG
jgi:nucleotide-binding universal stress UspA family protein